jgi:3-oxoacyl-[acyl-carrier protein] reductase
MPERAGGGPAVVVVGTGAPVDDIASGLVDRGAAVAVLAADDDAAAFATALDDADATVGGLDAFVLVTANPRLGTPQPLVSLDALDWSGLIDAPLRATVAFFQAAHARLRDRGGRIVLVVPTLAMSGAAGHVAWATVSEGQRSLAKSVARGWGADGITVNCVAVPATLLVPGEGAVRDRPGLPAAVLAKPNLRTAVAGVVHSLLTPEWAAVTGATIGVDGGQWMPA